MEKQKEIFSNIIGYDDIKNKLNNIVDLLNNTDKYKKIGCTLPHGLLIYGPPGTGKTSIAKSILDHTNRKTYIVRKDKSDGTFTKYIKEIFNKAKEEQPSIILLDDLDKFSVVDNNKSNNEEYVIVQSLIDDIKNDDVFVMATANDMYNLPSSLRRKGRFDFQFAIDNPKEEDRVKIFNHYLSNKIIDKDIDIKKISYILNNTSCAELEEVSNLAGYYAAYKNKKKIGMDELLRASLEIEYNGNIEDINLEDEYTIKTAYHEAGHALVSELLEPGSISFISVVKTDSNVKGITIHNDNDNYWQDVKFRINRVKTLLAGKAATEVVYNTCDTGSSRDIDRAYVVIEDLIKNYCFYDFKSIYNHDGSERLKSNSENEIQKTLTDYYNEVKTLLFNNRSILDKLANELSNKKILFKEEINEIIHEKN